MKPIRRFFRREDGPTAVEYAVLLALISAFCMNGITEVGNATKGTVTEVSNALDKGSKK
jgi:pilus assembly protein Flp/PilA